MKRIRMDSGHRVESDDPDAPLRFVIATEGRKADGIDLKMGNLDLSRFEQQPAVMAFHDYSQWAVGRAENVTVEDGKLMADAIFDLDDPRGAEADRKYRNGFASAVSVGFDAFDVGEDGVPARWELLEFSVVPFGMDADAQLVTSGRARALVEAFTADGELPAEVREIFAEAARAAVEGRDENEPVATPALAAARRKLALHEAV